MRVTPCPSPRGTNHENLYLVRLPKSTPAGALDAALRRAKDRKVGRDDDPSQVNLGQLRQKLESYLQQALPEDQYQSAIDMLDEAGLPGGQFYGEPVDDADPDEVASSLRSKFPDHADDDREKMENFMRDKGCSDAEIESVLEKMPRSAIEDRRRGGRDRRRGAMDRQLSAADSFEAMFGAGRIKGAL
jgi:hypothetical protein